MGLFDQYQFDPNSYDGGGLLAQLRAQLQNNQPSPLDTAQWPAGPVNGPDSPTSYASVGGYQMPVFGQAPQQDQATIPANAQPAQFVPQPPPQQATQPSFLGPQNPGMGDRLSAALSGFGSGGRSGGFLGALNGGFSGALSGQSSDPRAIAQQNLKAQYESLVPMLGPQKAMLAVMNPEAGKTLLQEALTNKEKWGKTGQDGLGREQYGFINERDQTVNGKPVSQQPASDASGGLGNMDLTGKDYLDTVPKAQANIIQSMVEGKIPPPSSFALSKPYWQNMLAAAKNYDPTFDATAWSSRVAGAKDFSAGKSSEMVRSANQTLHHVGALIDSMDKLGNKDYLLWNMAGNAVQEARGSGAQGAFRTNAHAVAEELAKVFKGSNLSDAEIHAWEKNLHENMSPEQQRTQIAKLNELLTGSLHALEEKRVNAIGPMAAEKAGPLLKDEAQRVLDRMNNWIKSKPGEAPVQAAPNSNIDALLKKYGSH